MVFAHVEVAPGASRRIKESRAHPGRPRRSALMRSRSVTKHKSPDERADQILAAARTCFLERGYFATKMDDIARAAKLSKGGVYFHFPSKREIFRALVQAEFDRATAFMDQVVDEEGDLLAQLLRLGDHFVEAFAADATMPRFMLIAAEMSLRDEPIRQMLLELQEAYIDRLTAILERAIADGHLRQIDARATAIALKSLVDGVQAAYAVGYEPDRDRLVEATFALIGNGLAPR
ncbi:TetR family transcriptional regulator [Lujinxingia vulgaris]|uniref:TetR family transcriptional regulator n=1 Tax=Lujinxingia vulgaris TaxID=2600176 RepID=A0A5C6X1F2_9DELT|nr:TetR family transcriptional regulator [Lujinxingia vulgaris]